MTANGRRIAVIGAGVSGLAACKNLLEIGFDVSVFEKSNHVGGLWRWDPDPNRTTVLQSTIANTSKQFNCYQDYPFPSDIPDFPTAPQIQRYLESYADHFDLNRHINLGCEVISIRPGKNGSWCLIIRKDGKEEAVLVERVFVATGPYAKAFKPKFEGMEDFEGKIIHAQAYKDPSEYIGQTVLVVGLSNSGSDIAVELARKGVRVYLSHGSGSRIVKRWSGDTPFDHRLSKRLYSILGLLPASLRSRLTDWSLENKMRKDFGEIDTSWRLLPAPHDANSQAVFNEALIPAVKAGEVSFVASVERFKGSKVSLKDGVQLKVDAVILATGYRFGYDILSSEADPSYHTQEWDSHPNANSLPFPRLYQTLFPPDHPDLAFVGPSMGYTFAAFKHADLASQAVAQVWSGHYPLPPRKEIDKWCDEHYRKSLQILQSHRIHKTSTDGLRLEKWLNTAAGNEIHEYLGWSWKGIKFWLRDYRLYKAVVQGIDTPFVGRLFPGREGARKPWSGARTAILETNGI